MILSIILTIVIVVVVIKLFGPVLLDLLSWLWGVLTLSSQDLRNNFYFATSRNQLPIR